MPGSVPQVLYYSTIVDVDMDQTNDVNLADVEDYGHRVVITMDRNAMNDYLGWERSIGDARPRAKLDSSKEAAFTAALETALGDGFVDIDGVTGGLNFSTANLDTNTDQRLRANGVSANDIALCFVLYKLYGNSAVETLGNIFNLQDAHGMLENESVSTAIVNSFKSSVTGALDDMFRDLLSSDPHRFFDSAGIPDTGIFETRTDLSGVGTWKLTQDDTLEIKTKLVFKSKVSRRGVAGNEHLVSGTNSADNQQDIILPDDYFYIRLQIKANAPVPTAPISLNATTGNGTINVSFSPGASRGPAPTNYKYSFDGTNFTAFDPAKTTSPLTFTGLTNGTPYTIYLRAVNAYGDGDIANITATPATVPSAPTGLSVTPANGALQISFTAGDNGGSPITNYMYSLDGVTYATLSPIQANSPITISGLTNGTAYGVRIKAINAKGASAASEPVYGTPSTVPDAPTSLVATKGDGQITVSFTQGSDGFSAITNYKYSLNGGAFTAFSPAVTTSPVTITGLTNGTNYTIRLKAVNANGDSSYSSAVSAIPSTVPEAPLISNIVADNTQLSIEFIAGSNGGSTITTYEYSLNGGAYVNANTTTSPILITGLTNDQTYSVTLRAVNAVGSSSASNAVSGTPISGAVTGTLGTTDWATALYAMGSSTIQMTVLSTMTDSNNNLYIGGQYISGSTAKVYNMDGNKQSESSITLPPSTSNGGSGFLIKYNSSGIAQWAINISGSTVANVNAITKDSQNNVYITGQFQSTSAFNVVSASGNTQTASSISLPATTLSSAYFMKYDQNGIVQWVSSLDGTNGDIGYSLVTDSTDNIYISGNYQSTSAVPTYSAITSGSTFTASAISLPSSSTAAVFLFKYNSSGVIQWATHFNGGGSDIAYSLAIDTTNAIYLAGQFSSATTIALNNAITSGSTYTSSGILLPSSGGTTANASCLIKYNTSGVVQWATYINANFGTTESAFAVKTDSSNNVYITGTYSGTSTTPIYNAITSGSTYTASGISLPITSTNAVFLIKYNSSGVTQWSTYLDGNGASTEYGYAIAIDSTNNVYLSGVYTSSSTLPTYNAITSGSSYTASSITIPNTTINNVTGTAAFLVKYNTNGVVQWATYVNATGNDNSRSLNIDSQDMIYLTGTYSSYVDVTLYDANGNGQSTSAITMPYGFAAYVVKYNTSGVAQGAVHLKGFNNASQNFSARSIVTDSSNNVYVVGTYNITAASPYVYNADNTPSSIILPTTNTDAAFIIKYNSSGIAQWATYIDGASTDSALGVTTDSDGNIYMTGAFTNASALNNGITSGSTYTSSGISLPAAGTTSICVIKYNTVGVVQWATYIKGSLSSQGNGIVVDSNKNVYIGIQFNSSSLLPIYNAITSGSSYPVSGISLPTTISAFSAIGLVKYDTNGVAQWAAYFDGANGNDSAQSVAIDSLDNVYITGTILGNVSTSPIYNGITTGSTYTASGISLPITTGLAAFLVKYNSSGVAQWVNYIDAAGSDTGYSVKCDSANNVYFAGQYSSISSILPVYDAITSGSTYTASSISLPITTSGAGFLIKYNSNGVAQWATYIDSANNDSGLSLAIDSSTNIYMSGFYSSTAPAGGISIFNAITSGSTYTASGITLPDNGTSTNAAAFLIKYNSSGVVQWANYINGTNADYGNAVTCDSANKVYFAGYYTDNKDLVINNISGTGQVASTLTLPSSSSGNAAFLIKYS